MVSGFAENCDVLYSSIVLHLILIKIVSAINKLTIENAWPKFKSAELIEAVL